LELRGKDAKMNKLLLENVNISPLYMLLIKAKLLDHNISWTRSKTFQGLKIAITHPYAYAK
jgi:hypothetical protein